MLLLTQVLLVMLSAEMTFTAPLSGRSDGTAEDGSSRQKRETHAMLEFLSKYGYLKDMPGEGQLQSDEIIKSAIRQFQQFNGLRVTGALDETTMKKMKSPRCGASDIILSDKRNKNNGTHAFAKIGTLWPKYTLTWYPTQLSTKLSEIDQLAAIEKAWSLWADVIPFSFQQSRDEPDIEIMFARGDHGDGLDKRFDGKGGVLAHAYEPGLGVGGDAHFDDDEVWTVGTGLGTDLPTVAAHEFGHSLGLEHSSESGALMAPYYVYSDTLSLHWDDVQGIQDIYGVAG